MITRNYIHVTLDTLKERRKSMTTLSITSVGTERVYYSGRLDEIDEIINLLEKHMNALDKE